MRKILGLAVLVLGLYSCKDFIELSLAKRQVELLAPVNRYESTLYQADFWFSEVEDALTYRLQVVSPAFDSTERLVVDTVVKNPKFSMSIDPGKYAWRVRAENGSSFTEYTSPRYFTILSSSIKQQKVKLLAPANNLVTNKTNLALHWEALYSATQYIVQVDTNGFAQEENMVYNQSTAALQTVLTLSKAQVYQWRVRAENDTAKSQWSPVNSFVFDHTPPARVSLVSPSKGQQVSLPANLKWNAVPTAKKYKLYVYKSDSSSAYDSKFPMIINGTSYSFNQGSFNEQVHWKVSAIDEAGNEGSASDLSDFVVYQ